MRTDSGYNDHHFSWDDVGPPNSDGVFPYICEWDAAIRTYSEFTVLTSNDGDNQYVILGTYGAKYKLFVNDSETGNLLKEILVRDTRGFTVRSPNAVPDMNGDGVDEIAVLITNTDKGSSKLEFYDSVTGKVAKCIFLPR